jgi:hypothetical protein
VRNECRDHFSLILVQHQYNNCTTIPHMRVGPSMWDPPSCEGLLYSCCISVVNLIFSFYFNISLIVLKLCLGLYPITILLSIYKMIQMCIRKNVRFITLIQQLYNNPSHEGGFYILGSTLT